MDFGNQLVAYADDKWLLKQSEMANLPIASVGDASVHFMTVARYSNKPTFCKLYASVQASLKTYFCAGFRL